MAKRFTATDKWRKPFIKSLPTVHKLLWLYILDECDHAGIWDVELEVAAIRIGEDLDFVGPDDFNGKVVSISNGEKWFIPDFITYQYSSLNDKVNAQKSALARLYSQLSKEQIQEFINPLLRVKDKDKDITIPNTSDLEDSKPKRKPKKFVPPKFEDLEAYCIENGFGHIAKKSFDYYEAAEWKDGEGKQVLSWKQKLRGVWFDKEKNPAPANHTKGMAPKGAIEYFGDMPVQGRGSKS